MKLVLRPWQYKIFMRMLHVYLALRKGMTLGVRAACFDAQGRIFLVKHGYVPGWHMPGGAVERGETAERSLMRELVEEGNLEPLGEAKLFQVYFNTEFNKRNHVLFYRIDVRQTAPRAPDWEIIDSGFFALDALPPDTTPATHQRLAELAGRVPPSGHWAVAKNR